MTYHMHRPKQDSEEVTDCFSCTVVQPLKCAPLCGVADAPCSTFEHTLLMQLDSTGSAVEHIELQPADVDMQDISRAVTAGHKGASFVVCCCCLRI